MKESLKIWGILFAVLLVIGIFFNFRGESEPTEAETATQLDPQSTPADIPSQPSTQTIFKMNEPVQVGKLTYIIHSIDDKKEIGNAYLKKTTDNMFLIVNASIKNNDKESRIIDRNLFSIIDSEGRKYDAMPSVDSYVNDNVSFFLESVNPGLTRKGNIVFEVPPDIKGLKLEVTSGYALAGDETKLVDLQR
ncbi:DUF4352 domain-containing protein [Aneurinibacillus aneurinilyticus]|nr:DUF4352 domain-containing protein [Aneurinibacillus aneurinilyticus]MED0707115.1 DUF4352 domain-containing protein [Aneurinibacillus aneurinilyticus]MED0732816.1 DUF4352 domain-containing protein [Aneurinibacillus aneurinilyticus]MED0740414.1 DUF4352 domain-containing protein [Aneurinibacillus aneurinilyticus]